ncbi:hypothetical protein [Deinococcus alpinitundrae]|uniref:hypothetical protein n=1 Tax=Deinococcus alpinitundrae TaxID=468913 RepID=UPI001379DB42|nr:hypothetical protein [Deinococcus alpinitundrae]
MKKTGCFVLLISLSVSCNQPQKSAITEERITTLENKIAGLEDANSNLKNEFLVLQDKIHDEAKTSDILYTEAELTGNDLKRIYGLFRNFCGGFDRFGNNLTNYVDVCGTRDDMLPTESGGVKRIVKE